MKPSFLAPICAALTLIAVGQGAIAAEPSGPGLHGDWGLQIGSIVVKPDDWKIDHGRDGDVKAGAGAFVGLRVATLPVADGWPVFVEAGYQDIARHTLRYKRDGATTDLTARGHAYSLAGRVAMPLTEHFGLYARLGVARASITSSTPAGQPALAIGGSGTGLIHGFGLEYRFGAGPTLRGELTGYTKTSSRSSAGGLSVGLAFPF